MLTWYVLQILWEGRILFSMLSYSPESDVLINNGLLKSDSRALGTLWRDAQVSVPLKDWISLGYYFWQHQFAICIAHWKDGKWVSRPATMVIAGSTVEAEGISKINYTKYTTYNEKFASGPYNILQKTLDGIGAFICPAYCGSNNFSAYILELLGSSASVDNWHRSFSSCASLLEGNIRGVSRKRKIHENRMCARFVSHDLVMFQPQSIHFLRILKIPWIRDLASTWTWAGVLLVPEMAYMALNATRRMLFA